MSAFNPCKKKLCIGGRVIDIAARAGKSVYEWVNVLVLVIDKIGLHN
jgi:hypothetical protein